ncbi:MAG TPA: [Fe-Fe] hydrogenase large subunit C-terminal domain-containing protein [Tenuifilaceae bacterium]|nr:[Fe-Fe] hydrogenase large subunit C-terminal domain-containing protein [Tenuifilaceae bacterium]HPE17713.1 [Fe-Fe] hydrogenase large subunit C-terminal domain-containing protein [Tenuifilaceae bacterium]HPJ45180.1 [Fe-Fe] hydrogenase large subunit C-terminal domain-containing protein [Tenuifilaceae bacterium]HPQ33409.1 [Fe-Fe] hydrogenase large subunit C-terminal domain-containing protein [Tenuifilaceae bacterium]HRX66951.1 [Fe-Fe] hydrogenase large subunit C-terminal domain-containing prote
MPPSQEHKRLVYTIKELCRVCYTCVRECPAKAIKIINGQAEVINDRCIGCGNCIKVCSQDAKVFIQSRLEVKALIHSNHKVAAIVAPSFPAEFTEISDYRLFVGMMRKLGFDYVFEVGFGADLVAQQYKKLLESRPEQGYISSDCPSIVNYIRYYHPDLVKNLAPIASPMVTMSRVVKQILGNDIKIVFVGPCIAKKAESDEVDEAITFRELRGMFEYANIIKDEAELSDFDPPRAGKGAVFPISRGLIQTVNINDDLLESNIIVAEGRSGFQEAIKEFEEGKLKNHNLELLCCEGCIMGPGMSAGGKRFERRTYISSYVQKKFTQEQQQEWQNNFERYKSTDLTQSFEPNDRRLPLPSESEVSKVLASMGKFTTRDHLNCGACGYDTCLEHAMAIVEGLAEIEMCLPYTIEELHDSIKDLAVSNEKLAKVQQALKHSEKLAHMGQLSAGIAHELNNPLGVVLMYSNILLDELTDENPLKQDIALISSQAERCKKIVSGLLNFARKNQVKAEKIELQKIAEDSLASVVIPPNIKPNVVCKARSISSYLDYEQMMQVLTNLNKNAIEAMPKGGILTIEVDETPNDIIFAVKDTGTGIAEEHMDKLYTPFFTTKGIGKGTGLGLATTYGIVKMHKGKIEVESNTDLSKGPTGTTFRIIIPKEITSTRE